MIFIQKLTEHSENNYNINNNNMLPNWYNDYKDLIENEIEWFLNEYLNTTCSKPLKEFKDVIYYSVRWWKKIRAIFALEFYLLLTGISLDDINANSDIFKFCIALELIHSFSLVHDDLPCMDNDELRRWNSTVWKKYTQSDAVLVWDLLNTLAFEILSDISNQTNALMLIKLVSSSSWFYWMLWWQVEDLYFENNNKELNINVLKNMHSKKTWALIKASILWWVLLSENMENFEKYSKYADNIWLAFQIKDDLLDEEWTKEETGKSVWWESKWYVHFLWLKESKKQLSELISECLILIKDLNSEKLNFITNYIWNRKK